MSGVSSEGREGQEEQLTDVEEKLVVPAIIVGMWCGVELELVDLRLGPESLDVGGERFSVRLEASRCEQVDTERCTPLPSCSDLSGQRVWLLISAGEECDPPANDTAAPNATELGPPAIGVLAATSGRNVTASGAALRAPVYQLCKGSLWFRQGWSRLPACRLPTGSSRARAWVPTRRSCCARTAR
jgi:hypothetical protein